MAGKADIVDEIADKTGISKKQAADAFEVIIASISKSLKTAVASWLPPLPAAFSKTGHSCGWASTMRWRAANIRATMGRSVGSRALASATVK